MIPDGVDVLLLAPAGESIADAIFRACRLHWRGSICVFQDASEERTFSFANPWVWTVGATRKDFFVFRDQEAAASWARNGAVKENRNTMFHFVLGDSLTDDNRLMEVAVVFDKLNREMRSFIQRLKACFLSLMPSEQAA